MKQTLWDKIKWALFGETRLLWWFYGVIMIIYLAMGWVIIHFVTKYW